MTAELHPAVAVAWIAVAGGVAAAFTPEEKRRAVRGRSLLLADAVYALLLAAWPFVLLAGFIRMILFGR